MDINKTILSKNIELSFVCPNCKKVINTTANDLRLVLKWLTITRSGQVKTSNWIWIKCKNCNKIIQIKNI